MIRVSLELSRFHADPVFHREVDSQDRAFRMSASPLDHRRAYVARQSRGLPIELAIDQRTQPFLDAGRAAFHRRQGQLNLSCSQCHDDHWGRRLAGNVVPQTHPTGYPRMRAGVSPGPGMSAEASQIWA